MDISFSKSYKVIEPYVYEKIITLQIVFASNNESHEMLPFVLWLLSFNTYNINLNITI